MDYITKLKEEIIILLKQNKNIDTLGFVYQYLTKKNKKNEENKK